MESMKHECEENEQGHRVEYDPLKDAWMWNNGKLILYTIGDCCPYCKEPLPVPPTAQALEIVAIRGWLHRQKSPICCVNMLEVLNVLKQVGANGFRALSPEHCRIYQDLAKLAGVVKEKPDPEAPRDEYCRFWSTGCDCPRRPFPEPPDVKIGVSQKMLNVWHARLFRAHAVLIDDLGRLRADGDVLGVFNQIGAILDEELEPPPDKIEVSRKVLHHWRGNLAMALSTAMWSKRDKLEREILEDIHALFRDQGGEEPEAPDAEAEPLSGVLQVWIKLLHDIERDIARGLLPTATLAIRSLLCSIRSMEASCRQSGRD